jgi:hypothetical protein
MIRIFFQAIRRVQKPQAFKRKTALQSQQHGQEKKAYPHSSQSQTAAGNDEGRHFSQCRRSSRLFLKECRSICLPSSEAYPKEHAKAGYRGKTGDCVVRSIAIATGLPYQQIYDLVNAAATYERTGTRKRGKSNARTGVYRTSIKRVMKFLGWVWTPTMQIGSGCTVHLRADELPGRLVVSVSKHLRLETPRIERCNYERY